MRKTMGWRAVLAVLVCLAWVVPAAAQEASFKDPTGDDYGPGAYSYPTDSVYKRGSFDLTELSVKAKGKKVDFEVTTNSTLEDPWRMGGGFSVQMVFIFVDTKEGGFKEGPPGTNVVFADGNEWDHLVILSPQPPGRVKTEVEQKMPAAAQSAVLVPTRTKGAGRSLAGSVDLEALGGGDPSTWGFQVLMQSNEGFPEGKDLLTRKVNEFEGQHRFGGGNDYDCDPHVMDILAGAGAGAAEEAAAQQEMLKFECNPDGSSKQMATLKMVRK
jgi:hypothetical protein